MKKNISSKKFDTLWEDLPESQMVCNRCEHEFFVSLFAEDGMVLCNHKDNHGYIHNCLLIQCPSCGNCWCHECEQIWFDTIMEGFKWRDKFPHPATGDWG